MQMPKWWIDDPPVVQCGGLIKIEAKNASEAVETFKKPFRSISRATGRAVDRVRVISCEPIASLGGDIVKSAN